MLSPLWLPPIQGADQTISQGNAYLTSNLNSISLCRIQATTDPNHPKGAMQGGSKGGLQMKDSEEMEAGEEKAASPKRRYSSRFITNTVPSKNK